MRPKTVEELQKELDGLQRLNLILAESSERRKQVIQLLIAAGFVTQEKVDQAEALLERVKK